MIFRRAALLIGFGLGMAALPLAGATLRGHVTGDGGSPPSVFVTITDSAGAVLVQRKPIVLGRLNVPFRNGVPVIQCLFEAPGYQNRRLTYDVEQDVVDAKVVRMIRIPGLVLSRPRISLSGDRKQEWIDVIVKNESNEEVMVSAIEVVATKKRDTQCLDLTTPNVVIAVSSARALVTPGAATPPVTITAESSTESRIPEKAEVRFGKCKQAQFDLRTTLDYRTAGTETHRVRVVVPHIVVSDGVTRKLDLIEWELLTLRIFARDGRVFQTP